MSDIDELFDLEEQGELEKTRKSSALAKQNSIYSNYTKDNDSRGGSRNDLEEIMRQYSDTAPSQAQQSFNPRDLKISVSGEDSRSAMITPKSSKASTKNKTDQRNKLFGKMDKMFAKDKKGPETKNKFVSVMASDPFSKPKPELKAKELSDKQEPTTKDTKPVFEEQKEKSNNYRGPDRVENRDMPKSLNSIESSTRQEKSTFQETSSGSRNKLKETDDNVSSINELDKTIPQDNSVVNSSSMQMGIDSEKEIGEGKGDNELMKTSMALSRHESTRPEETSLTLTHTLSDNVDTLPPIGVKKKKEDSVMTEDDSSVNKVNNVKLELDLLKAKPMSFLKGKTFADIFVPGNQKIIRSYKSKLKAKPDVKPSDKGNKKNEVYEDLNLNDSIVEVAETPLEKFEREDYEAARPLGVDEYLKTFMVTENPSEGEYSVPLTKLSPQTQISRPFYLTLEGQTTAFGKPKAIKRISNSTVLVGTSYGLICGFDTIKNIMLFKLGETKASNGGVTAIDYREDGKHLVAGFENGNLAVFDVNKKSVVKMMTGVHEAAIIALKIVMNEPLQYLSVDTAGIVMLNELERMMYLYNQDNYCIFSKSANLNFVQLEVLNHRYPHFTKGNKNGDVELVIAYAATQQIVITTLEPISKTKRILFKYPRPPMVYEGAIPHICWYEIHPPSKHGHSPLKNINANHQDTKGAANGEESTGARETTEGRYRLLMAWGFCVFVVEMRISDTHTEFEEIGYIKFGGELMHIQMIDKQLVLVMDSSLFIHLIQMEDFMNHKDFYLPIGRKKNAKTDDVKIYSERLDFGESGDIVFQTSFFFKDANGKFIKVYQNSLDTDKNQKECLIIHTKNVYSLKLNSWRDVLDEIEVQKNWLKLFTVGLALYHNTIKEIYQVPEEKERKEALRDYFKDKLRRFVTSELMGKEIESLPNRKHLVEEVALTLIDFCLETEMEDFLFTDAKQCLEILGFKDIFMKSLEPFIRWNKVHVFPSFESLKEIISFFYSNDKISVTQQLIANLDLEKLGHDERELFLLSLVTMCLETNLFTALLYLCIKGTENFTLPFFTFLKLAFEADQKGKSSDKKKYVLRCLWYIKTIFKRKVVFKDELIPEDKIKRILRDLIVLLMETTYLKVFCDVDPKLTTVILGMLFTGEISLFLEDLYGEIQLSGIGTKQEELKNNLHFQMLNKIAKFYEDYFGVKKENERRVYIAFIVAKVVENQRHKFLNENLCVDSARYLIKHHSEMDDLIILDYKLNLPSLDESSPLIRREAIMKISEQFLIERKGAMIERLLLYARNLLQNIDIVSDLIRTCESYAIFAEPICYLHSLRKEYQACLSKYLSSATPQKTRNKAIQWVITTMMQLVASKDKALEQFKAAVFERIDELVLLDPETTSSLINNYFKDEIKAIINKLSNRPDVQMTFIQKIVYEARSPHMIDDEMIELYIKLLAESKDKKDKKRVLQELKKQGRYPPKCLEICKKMNIKDAWAFLEEIRGTNDSIKTAIDLRFEMLKDYFKKCLNNGRPKILPKEEGKIRDRFMAITTTIENHFVDNNEVWFNLLEKNLSIENLIYENYESTGKQKTCKQIFDDLFEKKIMDQIIDSIEPDLILNELSKRAKRIPPILIKKFLLRILRNTNFELKFSEDARSMQKSEILSFMNVNILPYEVNGIGSNGRCCACGKVISYNNAVIFSCGHVYHANEIPRSDDTSCEICSSNETGMMSKILGSKGKKNSNQNQKQDEGSQRDRASDADLTRSRRSSLNTKSLKNITLETRFTALDRASDKLRDEVSDLVSKYFNL